MLDKQQLEVISSLAHLATQLQQLEASLMRNETKKDLKADQWFSAFLWSQVRLSTFELPIQLTN